MGFEAFELRCFESAHFGGHFGGSDTEPLLRAAQCVLGGQCKWSLSGIVILLQMFKCSKARNVHILVQLGDFCFGLKLEMWQLVKVDIVQ